MPFTRLLLLSNFTSIAAEHSDDKQLSPLLRSDEQKTKLAAR
jgi:hypothetical protein